MDTLFLLARLGTLEKNEPLKSSPTSWKAFHGTLTLPLSKCPISACSFFTEKHDYAAQFKIDLRPVFLQPGIKKRVLIWILVWVAPSRNMENWASEKTSLAISLLAGIRFWVVSSGSQLVPAGHTRKNYLRWGMAKAYLNGFVVLLAHFSRVLISKWLNLCCQEPSQNYKTFCIFVGAKRWEFFFLFLHLFLKRFIWTLSWVLSRECFLHINWI